MGYPAEGLWSEGWEVPRQPGKNQNCVQFFLLDLHQVLFEAESCGIKWPGPCRRGKAGWVLLEWASLFSFRLTLNLIFQQTEVGFEPGECAIHKGLIIYQVIQIYKHKNTNFIGDAVIFEVSLLW